MKKLFAWACSFESLPLLMSGLAWMSQHRALYDRAYQLTQPEPAALVGKP